MKEAPLDEFSAPAEFFREGTLLTDDRERRAEHKAAWGDWLARSWEWDWWVTLTYDPRKLRKGSATHTAVGWERSEADWSRWLSDTVDRAASQGDAFAPPYWFRGREPNPYRYGTHFHALVGNVGHLRRDEAWRRWFSQHGHARIEAYDPRRGAGFYVAKYVTKELGDLQFSANAGLHKRDITRYTIYHDGHADHPEGWSDGLSHGRLVLEREARGLVHQGNPERDAARSVIRAFERPDDGPREAAHRP